MTSCVHATEWHGTRAAIVSNTNLITEYAINCDTPNGRMKTFHLFSGVDYALTTFEAASCDYRKEPVPNILEIAYCKSGRFECEYKNVILHISGKVILPSVFWKLKPKSLISR